MADIPRFDLSGLEPLPEGLTNSPVTPLTADNAGFVQTTAAETIKPGMFDDLSLATWEPLGYSYTAGKLLNEAMQQMGEEGKYRRDYAKFVIGLTNRLIHDCFVENNAVRKKKGLEEYQDVPIVASEDDVIPYEYDVLNPMMVYGLGYWLCMQDEENTKANEMYEWYMNGKKNFAPARYVKVKDVL